MINPVLATKHSKPNKLQKQQKINIDNRSEDTSPHVISPEDEEDESPTPKRLSIRREPSITRPDNLLKYRNGQFPVKADRPSMS